MSSPVLLITYAVQLRGPLLSGLMLDNGLALMAAHLRRSGYEATVIDYNSTLAVEKIARMGHEAFLEETAAELSARVGETGAKIVGFKLYLNGFRDSIAMAARLRRDHPKLVIVAGGPQIDWFMESIYAYTHKRHSADIFDALVYGDADDALGRIVASVYGDPQDLRAIPNLILPDGEHPIRTARRYHDLEDLPFPDYSPEVYDTTGKLLIPVVEDSRSCDVACSFCIQPRIGGRRRERRTERVLSEVEHYASRYGWRIFRLAGPKPTGAYLGELAGALPAASRFSSFGYADQDYESVVGSGKIVGLFTGLESTDPNILERVYRKTADTRRYLDAAREMVKLFKSHGLVNVVSMIVPSPHETPATMKVSHDWLVDVAPDFVPCLPVGPMPGTPLTRLARSSPMEAGVMLEDDFELAFADFETDLLRPPATWPEPPWRMWFEGKWVRNAFAEITAPFVAGLQQHGMHLLSDEQVLMAYLYHDGLSRDQEARRKQCVQFNAVARAAIEQGDARRLNALVDRVNENQTKVRVEMGERARHRELAVLQSA